MESILPDFSETFWILVRKRYVCIYVFSILQENIYYFYIHLYRSSDLE